MKGAGLCDPAIINRRIAEPGAFHLNHLNHDSQKTHPFEGTLFIGVIGHRGQSRKLSLARGAIVMHAQENGIVLEDIAKAFNRDGSTLSSLRSRFLLKYHKHEDLKHQVGKLRDKTRQLADLQA